MNTLINFVSRVAYYLFINRNTLYAVAKKMKDNPNIKFDWKTDLKEVRAYLAELKNSGLLMSREDEEIPTLEEMVKVGEDIQQNPYKTLIQYDQSTNSCAIYGNVRPMMYNSWIVLTRQEHEEISEYCIEQWLRVRGEWMYFKDACKGIAWYMLREKGIEVEVIRTPYKGRQYDQYKAAGYACWLWGWVTKEKTLDVFDDGIVNNEYTWKETKMFAHCWSEEEVGRFTDNYPTRKKKFNQWENDKFDEFVKNRYHFLWCYFLIVKNPPIVELSDYDKYLERGFIENPQPERVMTEKLYWTFRERELQSDGK